jgi:hypothetical protein
MNKAIIGGVAVIVLGIAAAAVVVVPDRLLHAELDRLLAELPEGTSGRYDDASYGLMSRRATITGLVVEQASSGPDAAGAEAIAFRLSIDRIEVDNPNTDLDTALQAARADLDAVDPAAALPVAGALEATGVNLAVTDPAGPGSGRIGYAIERLTLNDLRLYPRALLQADLDGLGEALAAVQRQAETDDTEAILATMTPILKTYAALYLGMGYGPFTIDEIAVTAAMAPGGAPAAPAEPESVAMRFDRISGDGFDRGVIGATSIEGVRQTVDAQVDCRVARIMMPEWSVRRPAERLLAGEAPSRSMLDDVSFGGFDMQEIACTSPDSGQVTVDGIAFGGVAFTDGLPTSGEVSLRRLSLATAVFEDEDPEELLTALGLDRVTVSVGAAYTWDMAAGRVSLQGVGLAIDELGALEVSATLADVPRNVEEATAVTLAGGRIRYTDASLVDRAFAMAAEQQGAEPATVRDRFIGEFAPVLLAQGIPAEIVEALATFAREPKALTVTIAPPAPVLLLALAGADEMPPGELIALLGITVTAND